MTGILHIIVLTATLAVFANARSDYCKLASCEHTCDPREHTMCKYGFLRVDRRRCHNIASKALTRKEISEILNMHNEKRAFVASGAEGRGAGRRGQPAALNLGPLRWDKELADIAQTWANPCNYGHDKCRNCDRFEVGQNIGYRSSTAGYGNNFTDIVQSWYNEVDSFDGSRVKTPLQGSVNKVVGHYTQMMWAKTKLLGCGGVRYEDFSNNTHWYRTYLVCNYGPRGNIGGEMYKPR